jgi:hypothetical protein
MATPKTAARALAILVVVAGFLLLLPHPLINPYILERGVVEDLGFLGLAAASLFFFLAFLRARRRVELSIWKRLFLLGFAALFFVGAGEELSWGQQVLEFPTPHPIEKHNYQHELTIHNLSAFGKWTAVWAQLALAVTIAFVIPLLVRRGASARARIERYMFVFPTWLSWPVAVTLVMVGVMQGVLLAWPGLWHASTTTHQGVKEIGELGTSLAYGIWGWYVWRTELEDDQALAVREPSSRRELTGVR